MAGWVEDQRRKRDQQGFTLIELLVVIIILGILAAVVVFAVGGVGDKGKSASYAIDDRTLRTAEEAFYVNNRRYGTEAELVTAGLISEPSSVHDVVLADDQQSYVLPFQPQAGIPGGTLVVGETSAFPTNSSAGGALTYNPATDTSGSTHAFWEAMYNGLLTIDGKGGVVPELATRVPTEANGDIRNGGRVYILHLRNDVFFHDGNQFDSTDVKFTFEKVLLRHHARTKNMGPFLSPAYDNVGFVAAGIAPCTAGELSPGETSQFCVAFHFTDPYAPLLKQLNVTEAPMNPSHLYAGSPTITTMVANTIGTGPFKCETPLTSPPCRDPSNTADGKLIRNPSYWRGASFPYLDAIKMRIITDNNTRTDSLLSGASDWIWDALETRVNEVNNTPGFKTSPTQSLGGGPNSVDQMIFNLWDQSATAATINANTATRHPIFNDATLIDPDGAGPEPSQERGLLVRRAFFHATNRPAYLATRGGVGTVSAAPISSELPQQDKSIILPGHDLTKVGPLLDAAGWEDVGGTSTYRTCKATGCGGSIAPGTTLDVQFVCGSGTFCTRVDTLTSQLLLAKIKLTKVTCTSGCTAGSPGATSANIRVFTNRDFDLYILNLAQGYDPHIGVRRQFHSDQITDANGSPTAAVPNNAPGYKNAVVDAAFDNAVKTIDVGARQSLYSQFQSQVAKDLPYVWIIETPNVRAHTVKCSGFRSWTGLFAEFASCRR